MKNRTSDHRLVENPSVKGDFVVVFTKRTEYEINPFRSYEYTRTKVGVVRTLRRDGRPSRIEWLAGQYDFDVRDSRFVIGLGAGDDYKVVPAAMLNASVDEIENAVKGRSFASWDEIKAVFAPFLKSAAA